MRNLLIALNVLLLAAIVGLALFWHPEPEPSPLPGSYAARNVAGVSLAAAPSGGDFTLDGLKGPVSLHDFSGKLVLLYFGYTYCPDICPTSLTAWAEALNSLTPGELAQVQPIFVSVDPARDTVARLAEYAEFFHPRMIGLTGTPARIAEIAGRYGAVYARHDEDGTSSYSIDHSALTYLIDRQGRLVASLPHGSSPAQIAAAIRTHLSTH